jgi:hypothetical protein
MPRQGPGRRALPVFIITPLFLIVTACQGTPLVCFLSSPACPELQDAKEFQCKDIALFCFYKIKYYIFSLICKKLFGYNKFPALEDIFFLAREYIFPRHGA